MQTNSKIYLIIIFLSLIFHSCSSKPPNYYRKIKNNYSDYNLIGIYPILDIDTTNINGYHFIYNEKNRPVQIEYLRNGKISNGSPYLNIAIIKIDYSDDFEKRTYFDKKGNKTENEGVHMIRIKLNEKGHAISLFYYDIEGNITENNTGVAQYQFTVNEEGWRINSIRIDGKGNRIIDANGIAEVRNIFDENGYIVEQQYYNIDGSLLEDGIYRSKNDENGNRIEQSNYGTDEQLKENEDGIAIFRYKYDENGNEIERRYYGTDEQLKENEYGFAMHRWKNDENGNRIESSNYGSDEQLKGDEDGFAMFRYKYDENGNKIESRYYGSDELLKENEDGTAMFRYKYNDKKNKIETNFYGDEENLMFTYKYIFDINGKMAKTVKYNKLGENVYEWNE